MNNVGLKIRRLREERNISQEYIASQMALTQSSYGRLEKDDNRLTVPKIIKIAEVLNVSISKLFNEKATNFIQESNGDNAQAQIGTYNHYRDKEYIDSLKEEISFLRSIIGNHE